MKYNDIAVRDALCRLPIIQGAPPSFLVPAMALLSLDEWKCSSSNIIGTLCIGVLQERCLLALF